VGAARAIDLRTDGTLGGGVVGGGRATGRSVGRERMMVGAASPSPMDHQRIAGRRADHLFGESARKRWVEVAARKSANGDEVGLPRRP
jgi:hypothetical protein